MTGRRRMPLRVTLLGALALAVATLPARSQTGLLRNLAPAVKPLDDVGQGAGGVARRLPQPVPPPAVVTGPPGPSAIMGKIPPPPQPITRALPPVPTGVARYDKVPLPPRVVYGALPDVAAAAPRRISPPLIGGFTNNAAGANLRGVPLPVRVDPAAMRQAVPGRQLGAVGRVASPLPRAKPVGVPPIRLAARNAGPVTTALANSGGAAAVTRVQRIGELPPDRLTSVARQAKSFEPAPVLRIPDPLFPPSRIPKVVKSVTYGTIAVGALTSVGIVAAIGIGDAIGLNAEDAKIRTLIVRNDGVARLGVARVGADAKFEPVGFVEVGSTREFVVEAGTVVTFVRTDGIATTPAQVTVADDRKVQPVR